MITKIEHIGIAIDNIGASISVFDKLLNKESYKSELVSSEGVKTHFYQIGETKIELLQFELKSLLTIVISEGAQLYGHQ